MRKIQSLVLSLALLGASAAGVAAQQVFTFEGGAQRRGWLGFSYDRMPVERGGKTALELTVTSVVDDSPAERGGLRRDDVILRINGLNATEPLIASLGSSLTPGDSVTFYIRRAGREQDLRFVAAEPPRGFGRIAVTPEMMFDSAQKFMRIFIDSARVGTEPTYLRRLPGGRLDTTIVRRLPNGDSVVSRMFVWGDSMPGFHRDSATLRFFKERELHMDSLLRGRIRIEGDSVQFFGGGDRVFSFARPGMLPGEDIVVRSFGFGRRAIAGAELQELNPELARYFRVESGVLVTNVPENTPARRAGLQAGDVITAVEGRAVTQVDDLRRAIETATSASVRVDYTRAGEKKTLQLKK